MRQLSRRGGRSGAGRRTRTRVPAAQAGRPEGLRSSAPPGQSPPPGDGAGAAVIGSSPRPPSSPPPIGEPDKCRVPWQNSRIQTYYLANGLPSCGSATPCRLAPLPCCPEMAPGSPRCNLPSPAPEGARRRLRITGGSAGSEASRASLFCLEGHIENAPGSASCENSLGGRGRSAVERHYPPGSCPDYTARKRLF